MTDDGAREPDQIDEWLAFAETDEPEEPEPRRVDPFVVFGIVLGIIILIGMILLRPTGASQTQSDDLTALGIPTDFHRATVLDVSERPCAGLESLVCTVVRFEITEGPDESFVFVQEFPPSAAMPQLAPGDSVVLSRVTPAGVVDAVVVEPCSFDAETQCESIELTIMDGEGGRKATFEVFPGSESVVFIVGEEVLVDFIYDNDQLEILGVRPADPQSLYQFADFDRRIVLIMVAVAFAVVVVALGGWRGATALVGLVVSVAILLMFVLPAILDGRSPVLVAVVGSAAIAFVAMYLAHGINRMTTIALVGMTAALVLTALLSSIVVAAARFTGFAVEETALLTFFDGIDVSGLLLAGIVLGAAGALDDVTITQASTVWELQEANPSLDRRGRFRGALRVGRDHIASMVNTLLLAYAGASLPLLVLFVIAHQSLGTIANSEVVAVEIVRTLVGSIGLVAAVPLTTWLAARFYHPDGEPVA
ncbi:MAG: YibE/F family protein [Actinomycetota bacterium]|nr:YibE/F family protein [Actinomycetota bacterium]